MIRTFAAVLFGLGVVAPMWAEPPAEPPDQPVVVKLAPAASGKKMRALKYTLLPEPLDLKPGNAATMWRLAAEAAAIMQQKYDPKEEAWSNAPLKELPRREIRDFLKQNGQTLRLADRAARSERCDWELPAATIQNLPDVPFAEVQRFRRIAQLLSFRCRLELSEGKFEEALFTLQTGFALGRDIGQADTLIQSLVGIAITSIMLGHVEEWIQVPGSPNLFWALTTLPSPFIDVRRPMQMEMNTIYRSFPQLRELERNAARKPLNVKEVEKLIDEFLGEWQKLEGGQPVPAWEGRAALAVLALKVYPDAKKYLAEQGYTKEEIEALPALQAVFAWYLDQYNQTRDDYLKWLNASPWQALPKLDQVTKASREMKASYANPIVGLLLPAVSKVYGASVRTEYFIGRLRGAEALRLYAAAHDGKAPLKFADVGDLPLPINPYTGKGFDVFYQFKDGKGVLDTPAPPLMPKSLGRLYEIGK